MPRIDPDREERHGLHTDYFWPGEVHSVWVFGFVELRRERRYLHPASQTIKRVAWQLTFKFGPHLRFGERWERDR